jgi:hypothetical protein
MPKETRWSAEAQIVADELALLRKLATRRRHASWKMVLDRQASVVAIPQRPWPTVKAEILGLAKGHRPEQ